MNPLGFLLLASFCLPIVATAAEPPLREQAIAGMNRAAEFYRAKASAHGGYVYYCSLDFTQRWGEGKATPDQIFIQPPGTPAVGMAFLGEPRDIIRIVCLLLIIGGVVGLKFAGSPP